MEEAQGVGQGPLTVVAEKVVIDSVVVEDRDSGEAARLFCDRRWTIASGDSRLHGYM